MEDNRPKMGESSDSRYLERLEFRPELRNMWLNYFVTNFRVVILLIVIISAWGIYSFTKLPRESNPEIKIPIALVTTLYPGASPSDVEEFVTKKIEAKLSGLKGLEKLTSNSMNSISSITVEFNAREDIADAMRNLRDKVNDAKPEISTEAEDPVVTEVSIDDTPIWSISITGPYDGFTLRRYAEDIKDELEKNPGIREVTISGGDESQLSVDYIPQKLIFYGVDITEANQAIVRAHSAIPAGNFESETFIVPVRSDAGIDTAEELARIPVGQSESGATIFLRDIARVSETAVKKTTLSRTSTSGGEPRNSVNLSIIKRQGASILDTVHEARATVESMIRSFPPGISYERSLDMAELVEENFDQLEHDFLLTILLVSLILFLIVGLKEAFVAGLAIPLVFSISFGVLHALGFTLNFLSSFSLILALGLLVDDAIVVVSATKQYLNTGKYTPEEAVLLVLNDFKWVLTTTTLATVWAFLPLLFATGIIGEYLKSIPVTISITLIASLLVALMVNHPLAAVLERIRMTRKFFFLIEVILIIGAGFLFYIGNVISIIIGIILLAIEGYLIWWYERKDRGTGVHHGKQILLENETLMSVEWNDDNLIKQKLRLQGTKDHENFALRLIHGILNFHIVIPYYERLFRAYIIDRKTRRKVIVAVIALFVFSVGLVGSGVVRSEFFPRQDEDYVYIDMRAPVGTTLLGTDELVKKVEERVRAYPDVANFSTIIGRGSINGGFVSNNGSANIASITLSLTPKEKREIKSYDLADKMRKDFETSPVRGLNIQVASQESGPPAGAAFEGRIMGDSFDVLTKIASDFRSKLIAIPGVVNVDLSQKDSVPQYTFVLDPLKMETYHLNAATVGTALRTAIAGVELTKIIRGEKEEKVIAKFDSASIPDLSSVQNIQILNVRNEPVFLKDVADIKLNPAFDVITRIDQKRTILLSAGVDATTNSNEVLAEFKRRISDYTMPSGYSIVFGGQNESNAESVASILKAMIIALILIIATLVIQFNSFRKALIVLVPIPLALIGVFIGMALFDVPLSFPALIGVLALFGIVVKNAIILVDKININIRSGIPFEDAVVDAGKSRLEAIFITSICTIAGIIPVTLSNEFWQALGSTIIFGLALSSFLTLFLVPAFYLIWVKPKKV